MAGRSPAADRPRGRAGGPQAPEPHPTPVAGRVAVVGPCASGKSVLVARLRAAGYDAWQPAQEHSYVPDMWRRLARPEALIYLDVSLPALLARRRTDFDQDYLDEQRRRLEHARRHSDLYLPTEDLSEEEVFARVVRALRALGIAPTPAASDGAP
jgi:hypothetical protein